MLEQLYIKNIALIEEVTVKFNKGLNILTGETGAGKSIIIDSINFVLGQKSSKNFINKDADFALVEALVNIKDTNIKNDIINLGIDIEQDDCILISRKLNKNGKNICFVNSKQITLSMLKSITEKLIDIHGQHDNQSLLNPSKHIVLLDRFCEDRLDPIKAILFEQIKQYKTVLKRFSDVSLSKTDIDSKIDLFTYQLNEIDQIDLEEIDEEELINKQNILTYSEKLNIFYNNVSNALYNADEFSAVEQISVALNNFYNICEIDTSKKGLCQDLEDVNARLEEVIVKIRKVKNEVEFNPSELDIIETKLNLISNLKKKYGSSLKEIINYKKILEGKLNDLFNIEDNLAKFTSQKKECEKNIVKICSDITKIRLDQAKILEKQIIGHLVDLGMKNTKFKINISKKDKFSQNGFDNVEFLIATNIGSSLKPLSKIASGGEMSRVMLSLKAVLSFVDNVETFIFDEIDTGISGRTAQQVALKLSLLSKQKQIICITHLSQIAAMADEHFLIEKFDENNKTKTVINKLNNEKSIKELARMTGGAFITDATIKAAKEMKEQAEKIKLSF